MRSNFTRSFCLFILAIAFVQTASAQFTISGEFRPRAEYRDGYQKLGDSSVTGYATILGRSRLIFDYTNDKIQTRFSVQHAYVFGENPYNNDTMSKNTINIYEGWFRYNFTKNFAARIGRMALSYDDSRIFGLSNWKPSGATHDLVQLLWNAGTQYTGDYGFAVNNTAPASTYLVDYSLKNYKYMSYLYNKMRFFKDQLTVSVLALVDAYQKSNTLLTIPEKTITTWVTNGTDTVGSFTAKTPASTVTQTHALTVYARGTIGGTAGLNLGNLKVFANGYYQVGKNNDGRDQTAYFYGGWVSYQVVKPLVLLVGYEQLSGNNASDTTELKNHVHGFATPYSTKHAFYGYMDLYQTYLNQEALHNGLNDLYGRATLTFSEKTSLEATYRWFSLPYGYLPHKVVKKTDLPYQSVSKDLGSEVDVMFLYKPIPNLELNAAYCIYLQSGTKEIMDGLKAGTGRPGQYGYIMITYKPNFFTSEKK